MQINWRHPLVKRPLLMAGIEGGAIFILSLFANSFDLAQALSPTLIATGLAAVAGFFIGLVEMSTTDKKSYAARAKAKPAKKAAEEEPAKEAPKPAAAAHGDGDRLPTWSERAGAPAVGSGGGSTEEPRPSIPPSPQPLPQVSVEVSPEPVVRTPPAQPMGPQEPAAASAPSQSQDDTAELLSALLSSGGEAPAQETAASPPPPVRASATEPAGRTPVPDIGLSAAIMHPENTFRDHIRGVLAALSVRIAVEAKSPQELLLGLLDHEPDLIVTGVPLSDPDYFQKVRKASQYAMIVVYGDEDITSIPEATARWEPWAPLDPKIKESLGLPAQ